MAKTYLGIDIGHDRLKLALVSGGQVKKSAVVALPEKLVRDGRVVSIETMGELIRTTMKENGIRAQQAAMVLAGPNVYIRNVTMPRMTADQLVFNLPYEFRDYITDELKNYVFDYAMISTPEQLNSEENGEAVPAMDLTAVAVPKDLLEDCRAMVRKAGLRLAKAAPAVCSYTGLIRSLQKNGDQPDREYCILDLGHQAVRMHMFRGDCNTITRQLEFGLASIDQAIAEANNVDIHLAHTYLLTNHENCQNSPECLNAFSGIGVELMRALNFYRFSNPDSQLSDVWLCGGGAAIPALKEAIISTLSEMQVHTAAELLPGEGVEQDYMLVQAIGAALD